MYCSTAIEQLRRWIVKYYTQPEYRHQRQLPHLRSLSRTCPASFNASVQCAPGSPPARHVIIQQPASGIGYLNFCEVEIWIKQTSACMNITFCCQFMEKN